MQKEVEDFKNYEQFKAFVKEVDDLKKALSELNEENAELKEKLHEKNLRIIKLNELLSDREIEVAGRDKKVEKLQKENTELKKDISNMYNKEVVISIICDNFDVTRLEVLEMLGEDE